MSRAMGTLNKGVSLGMDGVGGGLRRYLNGMVIYDALYAVCSKAPLIEPSIALGA